ncbi:MAG TPA: helix-turn-helix domain-containing protein [Anaerolineaceae bacterium]|nr:helix-turn-helix domain-containing protein [Anaerolineaceae bacterium]HPN52180.1 helix-turn-helix domain-containing protein [Anaerolineaceae bacterium]
MPNLGTRIHELRANRNLTLEEVSAQTGLSVSFLSMLERNKVSISVDNLEKLARFYNVHIVSFFNQPDESPLLITRREQILQAQNREQPGPAAVTLLVNRQDARMEPLLVVIAPDKEEPHFRQHEADTLLYILEGEALLVSENGDQAELHQGDLAYYINYPHRRLVNASAEKHLVVISLTAPPTSSLDDLLQARQGMWVMSEKSK